MKATINVNGSGTIVGDVTKTKIAGLKDIKNGWGHPAFSVSTKGYIFNFADNQIKDADPYDAGIIKPLNSLVEYAKKEQLSINACFTITSDCNDYDDITVIVKGNALSTANSGLVTASTKELKEELSRREEFPLKNAEEIIASRDENNYVEGYIRIHINDMISNDYEVFLDLISRYLVGSNLLMDINYNVVGLTDEPNELILKVSGDVSSIIEE